MTARPQTFEPEAEPPYFAPACPDSMFVLEWHDEVAVPIVCHLEYFPSGRFGNEWHVASATLHHAYLRGVDIEDALISPSLRNQIESSAVVEFGRRVSEASEAHAADMAQQRAEDRCGVEA